METLNAISTMIGSLGFPIVMALILFWYMTKQEERHTEESNSMRDAINELKIAITKLVDRLGGGGDA